MRSWCCTCRSSSLCRQHLCGTEPFNVLEVIVYFKNSVAHCDHDVTLCFIFCTYKDAVYKVVITLNEFYLFNLIGNNQDFGGITNPINYVKHFDLTSKNPVDFADALTFQVSVSDF